jgi:hypothetical protein
MRPENHVETETNGFRLFLAPSGCPWNERAEGTGSEPSTANQKLAYLSSVIGNST